MAEATQKEFNLETFSHTTVSRSFRTFEQAKKQAIEKRFGEEIKVCGSPSPIFANARVKTGTKQDKAMRSEKRFPSATDTLARRKKMTEFFREFLRIKKEMDIDGAGLIFIQNWYKKTNRLLL